MMDNVKGAPQNVEQNKTNAEIITEIIKNQHKEFKNLYGCTDDDFNGVDDTKYYIKDFIGENSLNLIVARAKTGKSLFMQGFIHSLLLFYPNKEFYYIDNDNSLKTAKKRKINEIKYPNFTYINKKKIDKQKGNLDILNRLLQFENLQDCVIVFDSLRNFTNGADINKDKDLNVFMNKFELLRMQGACVFLLHHTKKGDDSEFRGGNGIIESVDNVFYLKNLIKESKQQKDYKNELYFILELRDSRDDETQKKAFYINMETKEFKEIEINQAYKVILPEICMKAYEILKENDGINQTKLRELLNIQNNTTQRNNLDKGVGILYIKSDGTGYRNSEKIYYAIDENTI